MDTKIVLEIESSILLIFWAYVLWYCKGVFFTAFTPNRPISKGLVIQGMIGFVTIFLSTVNVFYGRSPKNEFLAVSAFIVRLLISSFGLVILLIVRNVYKRKDPFLSDEVQIRLSEELGISRDIIQIVIRRFIQGG